MDEHIRLVLQAPRKRQGYFRIDRRLHAERRPSSDYLSWIDVDGTKRADGRYLIDVDNTDTTVTAATAETIAHELHRRADLDGI